MPKRKTKNSTTRELSRNNAVPSHERSWSELPQEIIHLFSKKLPDISDFIRFRAVCKTWQSSALVTDPPQQLPWLLERRRDSKVHRGNPIIRFYCLSSGKVHTIFCPGSRRASLKGPSCRYLLASNSRSDKMYLLNPLSHDQIYAPWVSVYGCPDYIGPDPIEGGDIAVISGQANWPTQHSIIAFRRPKADDWVYVKRIGNSYNGKAFYMGQHFSNDRETGITDVIDIATKQLVYQVAPPEDTNPLLKGRTVMVESGGKILRLFQHYEVDQWLFDIYYLYFGDGEGKPCWVKITHIGDQMLFLQNYRGLSFCASNFAGFKGNCIYFLEATQYLCRYDIGEGTTEVLPCPFDLVETWFVPSLVKLSDIKKYQAGSEKGFQNFFGSKRK